jgi:cell division protein FtsB
VLLLYAGPARNWVSTWNEARHQRAEVARLRAEHDRLARQEKALRDPKTLEREARSLGMVRPDERSYVILGLPGERTGER